MAAPNIHPKGRGHWLMLRLASMPLLPLFVYFLAHITEVTASSRGEFIHWLKQPGAATAVILFILCAFIHGCLGVEEIIIDYVPSDRAQRASLLLNKIFFFGLGAACLYAVMTLYRGHF